MSDIVDNAGRRRIVFGPTERAAFEKALELHRAQLIRSIFGIQFGDHLLTAGVHPRLNALFLSTDAGEDLVDNPVELGVTGSDPLERGGHLKAFAARQERRWHRRAGGVRLDRSFEEIRRLIQQTIEPGELAKDVKPALGGGAIFLPETERFLEVHDAPAYG
jgi:hypothetical protein